MFHIVFATLTYLKTMRLTNPLRSVVSLTTLVLSLSLLCSASESYTLLHRTSSLSSGPSEWTTRGSVSIDSSVTDYPQIKYDQSRRAIDASSSSSSAELPSTFHDEQWYQLALVKGNGAVISDRLEQVEGQVISLKECLLSALTPGSFSNDVLSFTLSSNSSQATIDSFTYDVVGINLNPVSGCPALPIPKKGGGAAKKEVQTKVHTDVPVGVNQPKLRVPPPPKADGTTGAEVPPPEKGFLQKYWYYILPVLVLLALPSEPPAGDGEAATGQGARRVR
ncbi:unnamed protein product [Sympodiomycopsis kandeliae]